MELLLYNTFSRRLEEVRDCGDFFNIYCCGPTVYGRAHIGNFRTYVIQDAILRILKFLGFRTRYVRNITDVDDKTISGSISACKNIIDFTSFWTDKFFGDCELLNLIKPDFEPKATETIAEQIELISKLVEKNYAYVAKDGSVYFRISSFKDYGKLSNLQNRQCETQSTNSAGTHNDADEYERENVCDFALWKSRKPADGEVFWQSPWGDGRPGWHIECSAMAAKYIGKTVDMHVGGIDLCFPHHENEIAQSEAANEAKFVKYWVHIAHLKVDGQKMSKSLGNLYTIDDLLSKNYSQNAIRYALLAGHYTQSLNFTFDLLTAAENATKRIYARLQTFLDSIKMSEDQFFSKVNDFCSIPSKKQLTYFSATINALLENLNTPKAFGEFFSAFNEINWNNVDSELMLSDLITIFFVFGFQQNKKLIAPPHILELAENRWSLKKSKNFIEADKIRIQLQQCGWDVLDSKDNYILKPF